MLGKEIEREHRKMERPPVLTDISKTEILHKTIHKWIKKTHSGKLTIEFIPEEWNYAVCINISEAHKRGAICRSKWDSQRGCRFWKVIGVKYEQSKKLQMY